MRYLKLFNENKNNSVIEEIKDILLDVNDINISPMVLETNTEYLYVYQDSSGSRWDQDGLIMIIYISIDDEIKTSEILPNNEYSKSFKLNPILIGYIKRIFDFIEGSDNHKLVMKSVSHRSYKTRSQEIDLNSIDDIELVYYNGEYKPDSLEIGLYKTN